MVIELFSVQKIFGYKKDEVDGEFRIFYKTTRVSYIYSLLASLEL